MFLPVFNMPLNVQVYNFGNIFFLCLEIPKAYLNPIEIYHTNAY